VAGRSAPSDATMILNKKEREELRMKFGGKCAYCGCELPVRGWHADHIKPVNREMKVARDKQDRTIIVPTGKLYSPENDHIDNLFPSCAPCNIDKHSFPLEIWRKKIEDKSSVCRRNYSAFRHAERFKLVMVLDRPLFFWFETYKKKKFGIP